MSLFSIMRMKQNCISCTRLDNTVLVSTFGEVGCEVDVNAVVDIIVVVDVVLSMLRNSGWTQLSM